MRNAVYSGTKWLPAIRFMKLWHGLRGGPVDDRQWKCRPGATHRREMETAYLRDMHRTDVLDWATEHGFTEEELAWIQPGCPARRCALDLIPWCTRREVNTVLVLDNET